MASTPKVLSPQLYRTIKAHFPEVEIVNYGEEMQYGASITLNGKTRRGISYWGETYRVNCPYCNDTRGRLWISHQYGQPDLDNGYRPMTHFGRCFNEDCLRDWDKRHALEEQLLGFRNANEPAPSYWRLETPDEPVNYNVQPQSPGLCLPIHELPAGHPAVQYLVGTRRYAPALLRAYGVTYCETADVRYPNAQSRIIIPIWSEGAFVGWQARYVGEPPDKATPKYYTMPGFRKTKFLYNFDRAVQQPYVVVVEGVTDVWNVGDCGVAAFGKSPGFFQLQMLRQRWTGKPVVLLFDSDANPEAIMAAEHLQATNENSGVVIVRLPEGYDPGSFDRVALQNIIHAQAAQGGIHLP